MSREFPLTASTLYNTPHAIQPEKLAEIAALFEARIRNGRGNLDFQAAVPARGLDPYQVVNDKAVVPVFGILSQRSSIMTSGGTSTEAVGRAIDSAVRDRAVSQIVMNVDSPGGSVFGIQELAAKIRAARATKPVIAVANSTMASAAYWLGSQASQLVVTPGGQVGSIGVIAAHVDESGAEEKAGVKVTYVSAGQFKAESHMPITDESYGYMQEQVNAIYRTFLNDVALGRRVPVAQVESAYGQGRMKLAQPAIASGMVDKIATLDEVLRHGGLPKLTYTVPPDAPAAQHEADRKRGIRSRIADMANHGLPLPPVKY